MSLTWKGPPPRYVIDNRQKGGQGPHFNVRSADNTRTGKVPGTMEHYPFNK
ncbi:HNH/endonuclease VII fold putative polymorphic toxin [Paenibacillus ihumii]|uniref:HNH/endonuclease VII fold putative polymorphic toxin n=1 Tax=Paenibacillus ihumii TaxID=687436 RepID=UPI00292A4562|nr:HNH/endonuclease VII fold putative polymorphic toxin [Paenibacillus ihumii]